MTKTELRKIALAKRNTLIQEQIQTWSTGICNQIIISNEFKNAKIIHIYKSFRTEVMTQEIIEQAFVDNKVVVVPETLPDQTIKHWQIFLDTIFEKDKFGILIPVSNCVAFDEAKLTISDLIVIPIVGFDSRSNRIGYGMGHYDRFLQNTKAKKIGLAFGIQQVENFKPDSWDIKLDRVVYQ